MPELPEVETVRRTLEPLIVGRTIVRVTLDWPGCDASDLGSRLETSLPGSRCLATDRRGKYLLIRLDADRTLIVHLRMTGSLIVADAATPASPHQRARIELDDGRWLRFADQRKFGRLTLSPTSTDLARRLASLGPEPIDVSTGSQQPRMTAQIRSDLPTRFDAEYLYANLVGRRSAIKSRLLDQRLVAGLGNIYVDEALFAAGVHPSTPSHAVDRIAATRIVDAVRQVLTRAIANRGTTLADYRDATGERGSHQSALNVFRRHGLPCPRCGTTIVRSVIAARGTHACPRCQPPPDFEAAAPAATVDRALPQPSVQDR